MFKGFASLATTLHFLILSRQQDLPCLPCLPYKLYHAFLAFLTRSTMHSLPFLIPTSSTIPSLPFLQKPPHASSILSSSCVYGNVNICNHHPSDVLHHSFSVSIIIIKACRHKVLALGLTKLDLVYLFVLSGTNIAILVPGSMFGLFVTIRILIG